MKSPQQCSPPAAGIFYYTVIKKNYAVMPTRLGLFCSAITPYHFPTSSIGNNDNITTSITYNVTPKRKDCIASLSSLAMQSLLFLRLALPMGHSAYLFSASIALIFCLTSSRSSLSFCTLRFISSISPLPFLLEALRNPRLFS